MRPTAWTQTSRVRIQTVSSAGTTRPWTVWTLPGVGAQVAPFRVQVHGRVVEEVPQRDRAQGGAEVDLMVPDLNGRIHRIFDPGGRRLH